MQNIEEKAVSNYQVNMEFFKLHHETLYNKLMALDTLINDGRYPQKYDLEYKDGYFDVIELSNGAYLYNQNSEKFSEELTKKINFKKNNQSFKSGYCFSFTQKALDKLKNEDALTTYALIAPIMHYHDAAVDNSMQLLDMQKFIFLGVGLGLHIPKIIKKTGAKLLLIVEENIELFRLSLFSINYQEILSEKIAYFSVAQNKDEFNDEFNTFYSKSFIHNYHLKFSLFSHFSEQKIKEIQTLLVSRPETSYPVEYLLHKNILILSRLKNNYKFLELSKKNNEEFFSDKPILIIGAGPSLHTNIVWLKENRNKFVLIAVFAALKTLNKANIKPDIVTQIDEKINETVNLINSFDNLDFLNNSIFIFTASVPDILFEKFDKDKIYLTEDRTAYRLFNTRLVSSSVGEFAYAISLIFNAAQTYLLGLDFALSDDGSTHAKDHHRSNSIDISKADEIQTSVSISKTVLHVKGNFKDIVFTTPLLESSIPRMNSFTNKFKSDKQNIYNLSDGAFFEQTISLNTKDINLTDLNKNQLKSQLLDIFNSYSFTELSSDESNELEKKSNQIKEFYILIVNFSQSASSNIDAFLQNYITLMQNILNSYESELREILTIYFLSIASTVIDMFNTKELTNHKKHTKKMKKIISTQLYRLIEPYEKKLDNTINEKV
ncbi:6-hydroxymethylpterin diphosphokinase MptE-like protein [Sulfurimonas sp.]|uniref:6-hydroxymethylpterin diphosphokinase MptE-like protein n=1 Tax=Sulfurimonas sp. TaxID=2022749 RepID=UPI002B474205|nr:6-hydroxymethylpterin diphosphokinase MptE-like protein [Sulfurimonas sp.]